VAGDFIETEFWGIDAGFNPNPDTWKLGFSNLDSYRSEWLRQAREFPASHAEHDPHAALLALVSLREIEINGDRALARKTFDGSLAVLCGEPLALRWQTHYYCRRVNGHWRIVGFTGYLPLSMRSPQTDLPEEVPSKRLPPTAAQHKTAGPYSPVLEITPGKLVVISGQAALDNMGKVIGETIEEQTMLTLQNCFQQLSTAGCTLANVFKVNIFMTDLA
jgi:enamine deaminase RidA (YjgF/YER057c/UK114 family)